MTLKLYRLMAQAGTEPVGGVGYEEVRSAIVWAESPQDALDALAEAFAQKYEVVDGQPALGEVGYFGTPANPYVVVEECVPVRGLVMAEGQDG